MMWFIQWLLVPSALLLILVDGLFLPRRSLGSASKVSGKAGVLAGLMIFLLFVISQQSISIPFSSEVLKIELGSQTVLFLTAGFCVGFLVRFSLARVMETRLLGLLTLVTVSAPTIALYVFFYKKETRVPVMFVSLAVLLGAFIHRMIFPLQPVSKSNLEDLEQLTADGLLRSLTRRQRIEAYSGLCDYLRWVLEKQGDTGGLAKARLFVCQYKPR